MYSFFAREARWGIDVKIQDLLSSGRILWIYVPVSYTHLVVLVMNRSTFSQIAAQVEESFETQYFIQFLSLIHI